MRSLEVVVGEPIHESHIEVFVACEGMPIEEVVIDDFPKSLYFSIRLRTTYLGILVDYSKLHEYYLKAMFRSCSLPIVLVGGELESII